MKSTLGREIVFLSKSNWLKMGRPQLKVPSKNYESASGHNLPVLGVFQPQSVSLCKNDVTQEVANDIEFVVTELPKLNLLGRNIIVMLDISVDDLCFPTDPLRPA